MPAIQLFTILLREGLISSNQVKLQDFHQIWSDNFYEIENSQTFKLILLDLLIEIIKMIKKSKIQVKSKQENSNAASLVNAWPTWFYKFLNSCTFATSSSSKSQFSGLPFPKIFQLINFFRLNLPGQLDADFIVQKLEILEQLLAQQTKVLSKNLSGNHDICVNIPKISLRAEDPATEILIFSQFYRHFNEYHKSSNFGHVAGFSPTLFDNQNNACVSTNFKNEMSANMFYQSLKYFNFSAIIKLKPLERENLIKILIEISTHAHNQKQVNFALVSLQTLLNFGKLFEISDFLRSEFKPEGVSKSNRLASTSNLFNVAEQPLLPADWPFSPILDEYLKKKVDQNLSSQKKETFAVSLEIFSHFTFKLQGNLVYNRLLCLVLSASNLFHGHKSNQISQTVIQILARIEISNITPEIKSLFLLAVDQFDAAGYNNLVFGQILMFLLVSPRILTVCQKSSIYLELHNNLFYQNFRISRMINKVWRPITGAESDGSDNCFLTPDKECKTTAIIARNFIYFSCQIPESEFENQLFSQVISFLQKFFTYRENEIDFAQEREVLKRDVRLSKLYGRFFREKF